MPNEFPKQSELEQFLDSARQAALESGEILLRFLGKAKISEKNPGDFVTEADIASQSAIYCMLQQNFPDHGFLGEESIDDQVDANVDSEFRWIVDPLDGTTNFIHGLPSFSISIALCFRSNPIIACVHDPLLDETFTAIQGFGAQLNGSKIQSSGQQETKGSIVVCSLPSSLNRESVDLTRLNNVLCDCDCTVRRLGSAALNLSYLACGRIDAYWASSAKIWDVAAGFLMAESAGGFVGSLNQAPLNFSKPKFLAASTPELYEKLIQHLRIA